MRTTSKMALVTLMMATVAATACSDEVICRGDDCDEPSGGGPTLTGPGTKPADITDLCDVLCACGPVCDAMSMSDCTQEVTAMQSDAEAQHCFAELAAADACIDDITCNDGVLDLPESCNTAFEDLADCADDSPPPPPPSGTVCDLAAMICGGVPEPGVDCSGTAACAATCVVELGSCDFTATPALETCLAQCT